MQDVRELLHEALEPVAEALDVVRVAVISDDGGNRREQTDGGRNQRFGDAGRDLRERGLLHVGEAAERMHDAPHRAEESYIRTDRAGGGEKREVALEVIHLALEGGAHGAARAVDHGVDIGAGLAAQLGELAIAGLEHALERADAVAVVHRPLVERVEILAPPELTLEIERLLHGAPKHEPLLED